MSAKPEPDPPESEQESLSKMLERFADDRAKAFSKFEKEIRPSLKKVLFTDHPDFSQVSIHTGVCKLATLFFSSAALLCTLIGPVYTTGE
uniref:Uncharacterized protein n=1 Tax=Caenorhabditis japonica TaxID=281687 RepID=A0A8R1E4R4_CAEJA